MKIMHGATAMVASALAMLLLAPSDKANARGGGAHGLHFLAHHHASARHLARHRFPLYGGYLLLPPYDPYAANALTQPFVLVSQSRHCRYDRQVVTVAAEQGGTRQITITRC